MTRTENKGGRGVVRRFDRDEVDRLLKEPRSFRKICVESLRCAESTLRAYVEIEWPGRIDGRRRWVCRMTRAHTRISVDASRAIEILRQTERSVTDVALELGINRHTLTSRIGDALGEDWIANRNRVLGARRRARPRSEKKPRPKIGVLAMQDLNSGAPGARGHWFDDDLGCDCGTSWQEHQEDPATCIYAGKHKHKGEQAA